MAETLGTVQSTWAKLSTTNNASSAAIGAYSYRAIGATLGAGAFEIAVTTTGVDLSNSFSLSFYGSTTETTPPDIRARLWAVSEINNGSTPTHELGIYLGELKLTLGSTNGPDSKKLVCDIQIVDDRSLSPPGMRTLGTDEDEGLGMVVFDSIGSKRIIAQFNTGSANTDVGPLTRPF